MARVIYGSIITDIKGSIGGLTFQKNGSGTIARLKPRKVKTNTQKQRDQQPRLKEVQRNWNELSLVNKILWNDFASVNNKIGLDGFEKKLTGYQWFLSINENRLLFDDSILSVPPVYEIVNPVDSNIIAFDASGLRAVVSPNLGGVNIKALTYFSFALNSASKFDFNKCRLIRKDTSGIFTWIVVESPPSITSWSDYFKEQFPLSLGNKAFYLTAYVRFIGVTSGISSLAYTAIARFVWNGSEYVIE